MRLNKFQIESIRNSVKNNISDYELRLFGSRVDDNKKGGDIDLLLLTIEKIESSKKRKILREIKNLIGEQKIDLVNFTFDEEANFKNIALEESVLL